MMEEITRLASDSVRSGMVLARDAVSEDGKVLLNKGLRLTDDHVLRLNRWRVPFVYVTAKQ